MEVVAELNQQWEEWAKGPAGDHSVRIATAAGFDESYTRGEAHRMAICILAEPSVFDSMNALLAAGRLQSEYPQSWTTIEEKAKRDTDLIVATLQTWPSQELYRLRMLVRESVAWKIHMNERLNVLRGGPVLRRGRRPH